MQETICFVSEKVLEEKIQKLKEEKKGTGLFFWRRGKKMGKFLGPSASSDLQNVMTLVS